MTLSPGIAYSCFELLEIISKKLITFSELRSSFTRIGIFTAEEIVEICQNLRWLQVNEKGYVIVTSSGQHLMSFTSYEHRFRQILLDYIDLEGPFWVQNAAFGRKKLLSFVNLGVAQVFLEAGLVDGVSVDVIAF